MNKSYRLGITLFLTLVILSACVVAEQQPVLVDPTGFVTYVHPSNVFTLSMPQDWVVRDTSDPYALNVSFSPPNSPEPLVSVYVVDASVLGRTRPVDAPASGIPNPSDVVTSFDGLVSIYQASFYSSTEHQFKDVAREVQSDGSLRISMVIDSAKGTSQHNDFIHVIGPYFVALRTRLPGNEGMERTLSRIINTLRVDVDTGWSSSSPDSASTPHDLVTFTSMNHWADSAGGFVIVGQVRNNAEEPLEFVRINALLYDGQSVLMDEQDDFVPTDMILPGEYAPFSLVFSDGLPEEAVRYDLFASARYADYTRQTFYGPDNFALTADAVFDDNGLLIVSGQVRNEGTLPAELIKVIVTILDADQRLVGLDTTLVDVQQLAPGDISTYNVVFYELGGPPTDFQVTAQGLIAEE